MSGLRSSWSFKSDGASDKEQLTHREEADYAMIIEGSSEDQRLRALAKATIGCRQAVGDESMLSALVTTFTFSGGLLVRRNPCRA